MNNKLKYFTLFIILILSEFSNSQCNWYNANPACITNAPTVPGTTINCAPPSTNAGRRNFVVNNMVAGCTYRISNCGSGFDTQLTVRNTGGIVVAYNDDNGPACTSLSASIDFVCPANGTYWIQLNRYNCNAVINLSSGNIAVTLLSCPAPCVGNNVTLNMFDSFGDGWNGATYTLINSSGVVASTGTLSAGSAGSVTLCLPNGCYTMSVTAGTWPGEVSWNYSFNGTTVASGGAPSTNIQIPINSPCPPPAPTSITASPLSICAGQSSTLTASGVVGTVYWYTGSCGGTLVGTGSSINVTPATTTTYFARNFSNGIFSVNCVSVTVTVNPTPPAPTVTGTTTICAGSSTTLTASNSTPPYTWYTNSNGTGSIATGATYTTPVLNNNTTYYVGGSSSGVAPTNGSLSTTLAGGNGCWSGNMFNVIAGSCNINITGFTVRPTNAGAQTVAVYYRAGTYVGFQTIPGAWILLGNYPINAVGAGAQTFFNCANISIPANTTYGIYVSFDAIYSNTGGPYTNGDITITPGEGLCNLFGGQNVPRTFNGTIHYQKLCNASCPSALTPVTVTVNPVPVVSVTNDTVCAGQTTTLTATSTVPGGTFTWSPGGTTGSTITVTPNTTTTYTATYTVAGCPPVTSTGTVTINPLQPISGTLSACLGLTSQLSNAVTPGTWSSSNTGVATISTSGLVTGVSPGTSTITYNASNGCSSTSQFTVFPQPVLTATPSNVLCFGGVGSVSLSAAGANAPYTYGGSPTQNLQPGTYTYTATSVDGCVSAPVSVAINQPQAGLVLSTTQVNVLCFGNSTGAINAIPSGGSSPYTYSWSNGATSQNLSAIAAGVYTVTVTDANGCTATITATITQPQAPLTLATTQVNVLCFGNSTGSINLSPSGGTAPYTYAWSNNTTAQDPSNLIAGTYTVIVTDANGCTATITATITQPQAPLTLATTQVNVLCFGNSTGSINLSPSGGTAPYTYVWSNNATIQDPLNLIAGTYTVVVTDANGCTATISATITQPQAGLSVATTQTNVLCFGNSTGAINATPSGGSSPYTYSWSNGATSQNLSAIAAGVYTVTVTDANGCTATISATITQPQAPLTLATTQVNVLCFGNSTGSINLSPSGGTAPYTYAWSNNATIQDPLNLIAGTYSVVVTDANGCNATISVTITQPQAPLTLATTQVNVLCFGNSTGSINLSPSGGTAPYSYAWSNNATIQDPLNLIAGTYTVVVTDANGCTATISATITQPQAGLILSNTQVNVLCFGNSTGSINLSPSGGTAPYTYAWSNNTTAQDPSNLIAGTYTVTVTDANGCTATLSATITQPATAVSISTTVQNILCLNGTGSINSSPVGGVSPYTYSWSNQAITQNITNLQAGSYTVTVTDANGCTANAVGVVAITLSTVPVQIINSSGTNVLTCTTPAISLQATGGVTYTWTGGQTPNTANNVLTIPGSYTVNMIDPNGCAVSQSIVITQNITPPTSGITNSTGSTIIDCNAPAINLLATGGGTYQWNNGLGTNAAQSISQAGSFTVVVTAANGCLDSSTVVLTVAPVPLVTGIDTTICSGQSVLITPVYYPSGGQVIWTNGQTTPNLTVSPTSTTMYSVLYTWNGCTATEDITVTVNPTPTLSVSSSNICFGDTTAVVAQANLANGVYNWISLNQTGPNLTVFPTQTTSYTATYTLNGCTSAQATGTVTVNPLPIVSVADMTICQGQSGTLSAIVNPVGGNFAWSQGGTSATITESPSSTSVYDLTYTANGCVGNAVSASIIVLPLPLASFSVNNTSGCVPVTVSLLADTIGQNATYAWTSTGAGSQIGANPQMTFVNGGCYDVTLIATLNGCTNSTTSASLICVQNYPLANFYTSPGSFSENNQTLSFINTSIGASGYIWNFGDGSLSNEENPNHYFQGITSGETITLLASTSMGCMDSISIEIPANLGEIYYIPNTFTPDGDKYNQVFKPVFTAGFSFEGYEMLIYNRWGELLFESQNPYVGWDGSYGLEGLDCPSGTYSYKISIKPQDKEEILIIMGHVNLLR